MIPGRKVAEDIVAREHGAEISKAKLEGKIFSKDVGWQNTIAEIQAKIDEGRLPQDYLTRGTHRDFVQDALSKGYPVLPEVLAD